MDKNNFLSKVHILDGAIGSLLENNNLIMNDLLWSTRALIENEESILKIYEDYINTGADIITTNTFRTNPAILAQYDLDYKLLVRKAVDICKSVINGDNILIAGSNPPAEDCYQSERNISQKALFENHHLHIEELYKNGVSFILNETMSHFDEIEIVCEFCHQNKIPFIISFYFNENGRILSGESLEEVIKDVIHYEPLAIGYNCISYETIKNYLQSSQNKYPFGFYLNCFEQVYKSSFCELSPTIYKQIIKEFINYKPIFIGSCCGSNPEHTKIIKETLNEINYS